MNLDQSLELDFDHQVTKNRFKKEIVKFDKHPRQINYWEYYEKYTNEELEDVDKEV